MQIQITLYGNETPEENAKLAAMLGLMSPAALAVASRIDGAIDEIVGSVLAGNTSFKTASEAAQAIGEAVTLAKLEAENPQFGQQPLPPGAASTDEYLDGISRVPREQEPAGPLAPSGALSPAAAEASASAPAAAPASIPPPPSVASSVPSPPPAAATPAPAGAVDAKGLPWDERIHASSRAKIADGSWRMKRGVQSHVIEAVEAELRAQTPPTAPPTTANGAPVPPPPAAPAPLPPGPPALTFGIVASRIGKAVTAGTLSGNVLSVKLAQLGFPDGLHTVNARPDMWQKVLDTLGA